MAQGIAFFPMVGEPTGGWGPSAICTFKSFAEHQAAGTDRDRGTILASELQCINIVIRRANARAVLCRASDMSGLPNPMSVEAAAVLAMDTSSLIVIHLRLFLHPFAANSRQLQR